MIAVDDIGINPQKHFSRALEIVGSELTEPQMVDTLARVIGRPVQLTQPEGPPAYEDMVTMVNWFNEKGYEADIPALRAQYRDLMSFESWLQKNGWNGAGQN